MVAVATTLVAPGGVPRPVQAATVCSVLSHHPCVYHPYHQVCSVFRPHACTYEPNYPFGEQLQLTIESRTTAAPPSPDDRPEGAAAPRLRTIADVFAALRGCWIPPTAEAQPGTQLAVRLSFKRGGEMLGEPRVTFVTPGIAEPVRQAYWDAVVSALRRCTPLRFSRGLGGALAGRPFAIRFVDNRDRS